MYTRLPRGSSVREKLEAYSMPIPEAGCWLWLAALSHNGYGLLTHGRGERRAHRLSYIEFKGPIPDGMLVLHHCDTRCCVNPEHLFLGTQKDNMRDCANKGRNNAGERNGLSKLSEIDVQQICVFLEQGLFQQKIADLYGVTPTLIAAIKIGRAWGWLTGASKDQPIIRT